MKKLLFVAALFAATVVHADQTPTKPFFASQPAEEYVFIAASMADMLTTLDIKHHPNQYETNFLIGPHPNDATIVGYFVGVEALHAGVTYMLVNGDAPKWVVKVWEYSTIGIETGAAVHNWRMGLRFSL